MAEMAAEVMAEPKQRDAQEGERPPRVKGKVRLVLDRLFDTWWSKHVEQHAYF